ncbi:MAG: HAD family hydrolase [Thermodesulfobacteriota bacterium]
MDANTNPHRPRSAVFLDRDGVINVKLSDNRYVARVPEFEFLPGVVEALSILRELGFILVVVTNQRGIAKGLMTAEDLDRVHKHMVEALGGKGVSLDAIYYCPHEEYENCACRKPKPGMLFDAARDLGLDLAASYMVGDSSSDMAAGRNAGTRTVCIGDDSDHQADLVFASLLDFALSTKEKYGQEAKAQAEK